MIKTIQVSRGLAALAVVLYHIDLIFSQKLGRTAFSSITSYGHLGVAYFFILSGFIIASAHHQDINQPGRANRFIYKRFVRVYPVYWLFTILFLVAAANGLGEPEFSWARPHMIETFFLVHFTPHFTSAPLHVAWTLFFEIRFYALFALAIFNFRLAMLAGTCWLIAIISIQPTNALSLELLSYWNLSFLYGAGTFVLYRKLSQARALSVLAAGAGLIVLTALLPSFLPITPLSNGSLDMRHPLIPLVLLGFSAIVLGIAQLERRSPFSSNRFLLLLGDASYTLYLIHSAIISLAVIIVMKVDALKAAPTILLFSIVLGLSLAGGILAHIVIEKPFLKLAHRLGEKKHNVKISTSGSGKSLKL